MYVRATHLLQYIPSLVTWKYHIVGLEMSYDDKRLEGLEGRVPEPRVPVD